MCGAGRPRVVLHRAKSFSPTTKGVRLRNLIVGGPVWGTAHADMDGNSVVKKIEIKTIIRVDYV